jgi:hypothetical protein
MSDVQTLDAVHNFPPKFVFHAEQTQVRQEDNRLLAMSKVCSHEDSMQHFREFNAPIERVGSVSISRPPSDITEIKCLRRKLAKLERASKTVRQLHLCPWVNPLFRILLRMIYRRQNWPFIAIWA